MFAGKHGMLRQEVNRDWQLQPYDLTLGAKSAAKGYYQSLLT